MNVSHYLSESKATASFCSSLFFLQGNNVCKENVMKKIIFSPFPKREDTDT